MIPQFTENPVNLPTFSQILSTIAKTVGPAYEKFVLGNLTSKLKGRVGDQISARLMRFKSVKEF